jgi:hypothetical protein
VKQNLLHDGLHVFYFFLEITIQSILEDGTIEQTVFGAVKFIFLMFPSAVASCIELTSVHTPVLITVFINVLGKPKKPSLYSKTTEWNCFRETLEEQLPLMIPLKTEIDIEEAVEYITEALLNAAWQATSDSNDQTYTEGSPITIKQTLSN